MQITAFLDIFGGLIAKKCWYLHGFCNFKKMWKARNTVNSGVLATFGRRNVRIYPVFFARDSAKPL